VGVLMGLILALQFVFPDLFRGVGWLVFSRLRQAHTNTVMFAFLSGGMMGLWLYIVPKLTARRLWSERLGNLTVLLWNLAVAAGIVGILLAQTQSREYAEMRVNPLITSWTNPWVPNPIARPMTEALARYVFSDTLNSFKMKPIAKK
jgi:cbb3-type cytochrome oxidase subunit 1